MKGPKTPAAGNGALIINAAQNQPFRISLGVLVAPDPDSVRMILDK